MNAQLPTQELIDFLSKRVILATMPVFNRLEARPRTHDFDRALRAEVRDALWMLTKQWQMGEFNADDAGSVVSSKIYLDKTMLTKYQPTDHPAEPFDDNVPLEAKVEKRQIPFKAGDLEISLDLRLVMGRQWSKLLAKHGFDAALKKKYVDNFSIHQVDPDLREDAYYCASQQSWRKFAASYNRHIDGKKLYDDIVEDRSQHVVTVGADPAIREALMNLGDRFVAWFDSLFYQPHRPAGADAWLPSQLEYQFACSAPVNDGEKILSAKEYYHGHLDWYNFSVDEAESTLGDVEPLLLPEDFNAPIIRSFIPVPVQFDGMPNTRWWTFEEGKTNFGDIQPDTTDINKLLLMEFGLIYANDWYLLPITLPAGVLANVRGMSVKNVFGENFWITETGSGLDDDPDRWTMYSMDIAGTEVKPADKNFLVVPSVPKIQESTPIEEIQLVRDEVANMVWGIETRVPLPSGESVPGREAAQDTLRYLRRIIGALPPGVDETPEPAADIRYRIMSSVPENWIPFISTHEEGSNRETRLQRGSMPRILEGDPEHHIEKVKPRSNLLREGLNQPIKQSYFINEEEVLRSGIVLTQNFQRTRWCGGQIFTWLGVRKQTGRGEASSHLKFDYLQPVKKSDSNP